VTITIILQQVGLHQPYDLPRINARDLDNVKDE